MGRLLGLLAAASIAACAAPSGDTGAGVLRADMSQAKGTALMLSPARYLFTDRIGVVFDQAGASATLPRPEPAVIDGVRVLVEHGMALGSAPLAERLRGFRSLPARLGGGYVLWSDARLYRAESFLGELTVIAEMSSPSGARPFLRSFLVRTEAGLFSVDPTNVSLKRAMMHGIVDALALDSLRAVRVDALGRASVTVDGGTTWTDLLETRGVHITSISEGSLGELLLSSPSPSSIFRFGKKGDVEQVRDPPRPVPWMADARTSFPPLSVFPSSSRSLPGEIVAQAVAFGALLPKRDDLLDLAGPPPGLGGILVARPNGLRVLSVATALPIADADLTSLDEKFGRCQPFSSVDLPSPLPRPPRSSLSVLALCVQDAAGEVLSLPSALSRPKLEVTFPETGSYVAGPHGRLGFAGRCGPLPPSSTDLGPGTVQASETPEEEPQNPLAPTPAPPPTPEEPAMPDLPPADDARFCARVTADHWIERRLRGDDARTLYRWIPGDDGKVTALILGRDSEKADGDKGARAKQRSVPSEGVRVIHLDPDDPALSGGAWPAVPAADKEPPYRSVDTDFWQDGDGSIRGWVRLPAEGETLTTKASAQGPAMRLLRVEARRGGRSAGVRIDAAGHVTQFALPKGTIEVVTGGPFGLAMAIEKDEVGTYFETTDGGLTWIPVEGPPVGRIEPPADNSAPFGCSSIGCALGSGVVRLGWGGPPPKARPKAEKAPTVITAANPPMWEAKPLPITCRLDTDVAPWTDSVSRAPPPRRPRPSAPLSSPGLRGSPPPPISLRLRGLTSMGTLVEHSWTGDVWLPFQPGAASKHLSVSDPELTASLGSVVPVLDASPRALVDLLLLIDKRRFRVGAPERSFLPFEPEAQIAIAADGPSGMLVGFDSNKGILWISRGNATTSAIRLARVADASRTRLTLARRLDGRGLSLIGYSTSTGEVFAGDIDLARAEIGPLTALGRIETIADADDGSCRTGKATHRFLAEMPTALTILGKSSSNLFDAEVGGTLLLEGNDERLCALAFEVGLPKGSATDLTARLGKGGGAAVRSMGRGARGSCSLRVAR